MTRVVREPVLDASERPDLGRRHGSTALGKRETRPVDIRALKLELLEGRYAVVRLDAGEAAPPWAAQGPFVSITRTEGELSVVCPEPAVPADARAERGWRCLRVAGPLGFGMTGILASLAGPLASSGVSIFVVSTYDTDYLLLQDRDLDRGTDALSRAGHEVTGHS